MDIGWCLTCDKRVYGSSPYCSPDCHEAALSIQPQYFGEEEPTLEEDLTFRPIDDAISTSRHSQSMRNSARQKVFMWASDAQCGYHEQKQYEYERTEITYDEGSDRDEHEHEWNQGISNQLQSNLRQQTRNWERETENSNVVVGGHTPRSPISPYIAVPGTVFSIEQLTDDTFNADAVVLDPGRFSPYSSASSRTISTDYGLYYRRMVVSQETIDQTWPIGENSELAENLKLFAHYDAHVTSFTGPGATIISECGQKAIAATVEQYRPYDGQVKWTLFYPSWLKANLYPKARGRRPRYIYEVSAVILIVVLLYASFPRPRVLCSEGRSNTKAN